MHFEDRLAAAQIRIANRDLPVEAAGTEQRRIEDVLAVRGGDDDNPLVRLEAVHLDEQLIQRLFPLFVAERVAAAAAADGVELVDEDDARGVAACVLEQPPHARGADARIHFDEVGPAREQKRHAGFTRNRSRQQRLARAGRADEQHALRDAPADGREAVGMTEEVDDLLHFVLGLVDAGDVLERDHVLPAFGVPGAAGIRNPARGRPVDGEADEPEEGDAGHDRAVPQRRRIRRRHDTRHGCGALPGR